MSSSVHALLASHQVLLREFDCARLSRGFAGGLELHGPEAGLVGSARHALGVDVGVATGPQDEQHRALALPCEALVHGADLVDEEAARGQDAATESGVQGAEVRRPGVPLVIVDKVCTGRRSLQAQLVQLPSRHVDGLHIGVRVQREGLPRRDGHHVPAQRPASAQPARPELLPLRAPVRLGGKQVRHGGSPVLAERVAITDVHPGRGLQQLGGVRPREVLRALDVQALHRPALADLHRLAVRPRRLPASAARGALRRLQLVDPLHDKAAEARGAAVEAAVFPSVLRPPVVQQAAQPLDVLARQPAIAVTFAIALSRRAAAARMVQQRLHCARAP
mmetsp:Transcript_34064/g.87100  ORF Transcript_34064/g.87100 Transcript_34064/m.87100 type:complete len:335 (-) Transcript_34064:167-1171(-)